MESQLKNLKYSPKYSWKKVFLVLLISSSFTASLGVIGFIFFLKERSSGMSSVQSLIESAQNGISLPSLFFQELLDLSHDHPTNIKHFSLTQAETTLLAAGIIEQAVLKKVKPHSLLIQYRVRNPLFFLKDYSNTAMDKEGFFFPFTPFFSPQKLPQIYLGGLISTPVWGQSLDSKSLAILEEILSKIALEEIDQIDLSKIAGPHSGQKEIVILLKNRIMLRLSLWNLTQQLCHFQILLQNHHGSSELIQLLKERPGSLIIDLRLTGLAFIK